MAANRIIPGVLFALFAFSAAAQEKCYMVFFTDKQGVTQSLDRPVEFLSERAIERRLRTGTEVLQQDLPVSPVYLKEVRDAGAVTRYTTRWMNGVLVQCDPDVLPTLEAFPFVTAVEYVGPVPEGIQGRRSANHRRKERHGGAETESQLKMIGIDRLHAAGSTGEGVVIAVFDSGFPGVNTSLAFEHIFSNGRFEEAASYNFVRNVPDVFQEDDHGTAVLSVIAANIPDLYTGGAYDATFQLYVTEDARTEYRIEEYNWLFAAERADSAGADIINSSLGYYDFDDAAMNYSREDMDGVTTVVSRAARWATDRGVVVVTSAGNEGYVADWRIITAPADAEGVLAVGAVNAQRQKTGSSSVGPTADDRMKPDLAALGQGVRVVRANGQTGSMSGTSFSAPLVTSLVAGVMQHFPDLTGPQVVELLKQTASQGEHPDNRLGYGIPSFQALEEYLAGTPPTGAFDIFPNPLSGDTLIIRSRDPEATNLYQVELVSAQGQLLGSDTVQLSWMNRAYKADLTALPAGIYFVRVGDGKTRHTYRLVRL